MNHPGMALLSLGAPALALLILAVLLHILHFQRKDTPDPYQEDYERTRRKDSQR